MPNGIQWSAPEGGMFIWLQVPEQIDCTALLHEAVERHVAFFPGAPFYAEDPRHNTLRLAFVTVQSERIQQGASILGELIRSRLGGRP